MKSMFKSNSKSVLYLTILYSSSIHINKYILSVLGFTFPTVFQGWQTLVTVILLKVLLYNNLTPMSWCAFIEHMPLFVCYVGGIVSGSKVLSVLPVPVVIVFSNVIPAILHLCHSPLEENNSYSAVVAAVLSIFTAACTFCLDPILSEMGISSLWLFLHIFSVGAQAFLSNERTFTGFDKLFYCNLFSVVVLAPSSLYLEEAFEALHFQELRQVGFLLGCVLSGIVGTLLLIFTVNSAAVPSNYFAVSKAISCLLSPFILHCSLSFPIWTLLITNISATSFIPLKPLAAEENEGKLINVDHV